MLFSYHIHLFIECQLPGDPGARMVTIDIAQIYLSAAAAYIFSIVSNLHTIYILLIYDSAFPTMQPDMTLSVSAQWLKAE